MVQSNALESPTAPARLRRRKIADPDVWPAVYLEALALTGMQNGSAKAAKVAFSAVFRRRKSDPVFAQAEQEALQTAKGAAEDELRRRAIEGCAEKHFDRQGNLIAEKRVYSDTLLLRLLEKLDPTWRQKHQLEHSGGVNFDSREERKKALEEARKAMDASLS